MPLGRRAWLDLPMMRAFYRSGETWAGRRLWWRLGGGGLWRPQPDSHPTGRRVRVCFGRGNATEGVEMASPNGNRPFLHR
jgi:hypothetical protein